MTCVLKKDYNYIYGNILSKSSSLKRNLLSRVMWEERGREGKAQ